VKQGSRWPVISAGSELTASLALLGERLPAASDQTVVLVEGSSDQAAIEALARRAGRDLAAEGVLVLPMGGVTNIGRFLRILAGGPRLAGLCDVAEQPAVARALHAAGLAPAGDPAALAARGFFACVADLEDELIRALGAEAAEQVIAEQGEQRSLRIMRRQPAQRGRTAEQQLHRFIAGRSGRKAHYARVFAEALEPARIPRPLGELLAYLQGWPGTRA
jgi:hypothetical protein